MSKRSGVGMSRSEQKRAERLRDFVETWKNYQGTEQSGAQDFLRALLDIYGVSVRPGTAFEQHPVRTPARSARARPKLTPVRMDMYLPGVCVWEMKGPSEKDLGKHHEQLLRYWAWTRTPYMVLCNFREFWIYDTADESGHLLPKLRLKLSDLPSRGDALLFLCRKAPNLARRSRRATVEIHSILGWLVHGLLDVSPQAERDHARTARLISQCVFTMFGDDTDAAPAGTADPLWSFFMKEAEIARVVGPTVVEPWRKRIKSIRTLEDAERVVSEMRAFHVLDPACGCGNFLYVVYREMKRLESALAARWDALAGDGSDARNAPPRPYFTLEQIHGIDTNDFATFLARVVLLVGEHLTKHELGFENEGLSFKTLEANVRTGDALFANWPRPEGDLAIVGNPPFMGARRMPSVFSSEYIERLHERYPNSGAADYVTYWFARAIEVMRPGERAGFITTNSIGQKHSRAASIEKIIAKGGTITEAWTSCQWPGSAIYVGIVNWVMSPHRGVKRLDGQKVRGPIDLAATHHRERPQP